MIPLSEGPNCCPAGYHLLRLRVIGGSVALAAGVQSRIPDSGSRGLSAATDSNASMQTLKTRKTAGNHSNNHSFLWECRLCAFREMAFLVYKTACNDRYDWTESVCEKTLAGLYTQL